MLVRLENWSYVTARQHSGHSGLCGNIYDHPQFKDGKSIITSPIWSYNSEDDTFISNSGNAYQLGKIDPEYEAMCPQAKEKLIAFLAKHKQSSSNDLVLKDNDIDKILLEDADQ